MTLTPSSGFQTVRMATSQPLTSVRPRKNLFALLQTCSEVRYFDFPSSFWASLARRHVARYTAESIGRWRSDTAGGGDGVSDAGVTDTASASAAAGGGGGGGDEGKDGLRLAIQEAFTTPVEKALEVAVLQPRHLGSGSGERGEANERGRTSCSGVISGDVASSRDVFFWWMFSPAWRSRRRVWRCVVSGCAKARDANGAL